jgi:hypothetical protein
MNEKQSIAEENKSQKPKKNSPLLWGLLFGIVFGFLLQKGGVTKYDVIVGQLLLEDFTVLKVILTAVIVGMIGIHAMKSFGWVQLHPKSGSFGMNVFGGLIFGVGFAVLGYCPGTVAGAVGNGYLDALVGGVIGILLGAGIFANIYPRLRKGVLKKGFWGDVTFPKLFRVNDWVIVVPFVILLSAVLWFIESRGF